MKIRIDFVTNSSSTSFMAINVSTGILETYLRKNGIEDLIDNLNNFFEILEAKGDIIEAELEKSFSRSLVAVLEAIAEGIDCGEIDEDDYRLDLEANQDLIKFVKKNSEQIDAEAEGSIEMKYSDGENGYAFVQSLEYKKHHGKLVKWPCKEVTDLAYWDIVWDDKALAKAIEKTGVVEEFEVAQPEKKADVDYEKEL